MSILCKLLIVACPVLMLSLAASGAALKATKLRCEYKSNPLGIDVVKPRLSWVLEATDPVARDLKQVACEIQVASARERLAADGADLWNTGKVASDETIQIVYGGQKLRSRQECWWRVRVWSDDGEPSAWSEPARWSMGLMEPGDWKAKWIGYDEPEGNVIATWEKKDPVNLDGLKWIWTDEGDATNKAAKGTRYFAARMKLPEDKVSRAVFIGCADDNFSLAVNGKKAGAGNGHTRAYELDVAEKLRAGENVLTIEAANGGENPAALIGRFVVWIGEAREPVVFDIDGSWKFAVEKPAKWDEGQVEFDKLKVVKEFVAVGEKPWGTPEKRTLDLPPPPMMRKAFESRGNVKRAMVYATARGLYELTVNGARVGQDLFTPGWTDYKKRIYYNACDVTRLVKDGPNAITALLGDGWYAGYFSYQGKRELYGKHPRVMVQLEIEYDDGRTQTIVTDNTWKCAYGPWREADLLQGSAYDTRKENGHWGAPGFDDSSWKPAKVDEPPKVPLGAYPGDPVRRQEKIAAKAVTEPSPGVYVFDLGQNMVGFCRLKIGGIKEGTKITLRHAEMLQPDGNLYLTSLRQARAMDTYWTAGRDEEVWEPKFTFHGFRYVEVKGLPGKPSLDAITGIVVNADMEQTGEFECSNPLVNQLFHNIIWGQKGNYLEVPTDCPQRDERLGWTGDAQFFIRTGAYNFDVSAFFTKWLTDLITDAQFEDGSFADVAPDLLGGHGNTAWQDAAIVCPYTIYKIYGDTRLIEQHYPAMVKYIEYLKTSSKDLIRGQGAYGDWVNLGGGAKSEVVGTAYFEHATRLVAEMAAAIGKNDAADKFRKLADDVRAAFIKNFVADDGSIKESSQTGYALAFTMDLLPADKRKLASEKFVSEIEKKDWHLATGFIGTPRLFPALTLAGRSDVAYRLLLTESFPSWLFQVKLGATTMWERWDGWTPDKGFQDPGMNSFNHYAFGSVGEWMWRTVAGIDTDGPGFKKIILRPTPDPSLPSAKATYHSIRGPITSDWKREGDTLTVKFVVPPNTTATAYLPAKDPASVTESGKPTRDAAGVRFLWTEGGSVVYRLGSGMYEFVSPQ